MEIRVQLTWDLGESKVYYFLTTSNDLTINVG